MSNFKVPPPNLYQLCDQEQCMMTPFPNEQIWQMCKTIVFNKGTLIEPPLCRSQTTIIDPLVRLLFVLCSHDI